MKKRWLTNSAQGVEKKLKISSYETENRLEKKKIKCKKKKKDFKILL